MVTACIPVGVNRQPTAETACVGQAVTLSAAFSGSSPSLQWRKDGTPIPGATSATYLIASPLLTDSGVYDCVATNACGSATTAGATLSVSPNLTIASQPVDQSVEVDSPVTFLVQMQTVEGCETPLAYQWQRRNPLVADPDAPNAWVDLQEGSQFINTRSSALVIARPIPALATGFRCRIGGGCGCRPASGFLNTETVNFSIACPADFNADGGVDFGDIELFFERWENGC
jgi:hypothetical protein